MSKWFLKVAIIIAFCLLAVPVTVLIEPQSTPTTGYDIDADLTLGLPSATFLTCNDGNSGEIPPIVLPYLVFKRFCS